MWFVRAFILWTIISITMSMRAVHIKEFGGPSVLTVAHDAIKPKAAANQVVIKVHATAINRADTLQRAGTYAASFPTDGSYFIPGLECSGVIHDVGPGAQDMFAMMLCIKTYVGENAATNFTQRFPKQGCNCDHCKEKSIIVVEADQNIFLGASLSGWTLSCYGAVFGVAASAPEGYVIRVSPTAEIGPNPVQNIKKAGQECLFDDITHQICLESPKTKHQMTGAMLRGGYAEYVSAPKQQVMKVPSNINLTEAAAIPEVWLTAYQLLYFVARFRAGETVLVHAAGSGVGTAAVQLVTAAGGKAIAVAGTETKLAKARELGAYVTVNYKATDFEEEVKKVTDGKGVDIILDCIGAQNWQKNMAVLALEGRWVLYGLMGGGHIEGNFFKLLLAKRGELLTSLLKVRSVEYKAKLVRAFSESCLPMFASSSLLPVIDSVFPLEEITLAHERMEANLNLGKILIRIEEPGASKEEL